MSEEIQRHAAFCELIYDVGRNAGEVRLKVTGASMLPAIRPGDEILVRRCELTELQVGQIVLYCRDERLTAHRVQNVTADNLITRGDSVPTVDLPVQSDEIVGRVVSITRGTRLINPAQTSWQRMASSILRNSDFCLRVTLFIYRRIQPRVTLSN